MINSCNDTKGIIMAIRYNKLWKKLIDENMMKVDLRDQAGITTNALAKLVHRFRNNYTTHLSANPIAQV